MNLNESIPCVLGIVIPTFNRAQHLEALLTTLKNQVVYQTTRIEIVVVNDGSTDHTSDVVKKFEHVHELHGNGSWWFTRCVQEGSLRAIALGCTVIQIINDDCIPADGFLETTLLHVAASEKFFVFAPISITIESPKRIMFGGVRFKFFGLKRIRSFAPLERYLPSVQQIPSDVLPGRGMTYSSALFEELSGFDTALLQYHSDEDFCLRAREKNIQPMVYTDLVLMGHHQLTAGGSSLKKSGWLQLMRSMFQPQSRVYLPDRIRIIAKHQPIILAPLLFIAHIVLIFRSNLK